MIEVLSPTGIEKVMCRESNVALISMEQVLTTKRVVCKRRRFAARRRAGSRVHMVAAAYQYQDTSAMANMSVPVVPPLLRYSSTSSKVCAMAALLDITTRLHTREAIDTPVSGWALAIECASSRRQERYLVPSRFGHDEMSGTDQATSSVSWPGDSYPRRLSAELVRYEAPHTAPRNPSCIGLRSGWS